MPKSKFYNFLISSNYFNNKRLNLIIFNYINENIDKTLDNKKIKEKVEEIINNDEYVNSLNIFIYPYFFIDLKTIKSGKIYKTYKLEDFINNNKKDNKSLDYFILKFNNKKLSDYKENKLKILKSKVKINNTIYILSSALYENGDILKIQYKNIYDLTDEEYEIRQEYFILNNIKLSAKEIKDKYETHNGDDEYLKEDGYSHKILYCLYEKYEQNTEFDFIETFDYSEVDEKYEYIQQVYVNNLKKIKDYDYNNIIREIIKPLP